MATTPTVPAGVRATLLLLARIHTDLDASAQTRTAARSSTAQHATRPLGTAEAPLSQAS